MTQMRYRRLGDSGFVLATKFGHDLGGTLGDDGGARGSRRYVRKAVERSLRGCGPTGSTSTSCIGPTR
jgi:aryl-alcohol dehydrogenase-like predicted oxidoreductase